MKRKYYAPVATIIELDMVQNILLDMSSDTSKGGGSALGKKEQDGAWGNLWQK